MGYLIATPINPPIASFYKLEDGTILSALVRINHVLTDPSGSALGAVNHGIDLQTFVPSRSKSPRLLQQNQSPTIIDQDVKCITIREEFNDYTVGDDIMVSAKAVVGQVMKTDAHTQLGEPIYNINVQPMIKTVTNKGRQTLDADLR